MMKKFWRKFFIYLGYFVVVLALALIFNWPQEFDSYVVYSNYKFSSHCLLFFYRILIYMTLPFILSAFEKNKSKEKYKRRLLSNFNVQFISYSIIAGLYVILGMDKVLGVAIFDSADAILFLAGFIFTTILDKQIPSLIDIKK